MGEGTQPAAKILIADDDAQVRGVLRRFLEKRAFEVIEAGDGEATIAKTREEAPHVILLDIRMPEKDGLEVLKEVREFAPEIGVIMITGAREEYLGRQALAQGAFDYICKPIDFAYLERALLVKLRLMPE